jgi:hypothetical protein
MQIETDPGPQQHGQKVERIPQKKPPEMESLSLAPDFFKPESQHNMAKIKKVLD